MSFARPWHPLVECGVVLSSDVICSMCLHFDDEKHPRVSMIYPRDDMSWISLIPGLDGIIK